MMFTMLDTTLATSASDSRIPMPVSRGSKYTVVPPSCAIPISKEILVRLEEADENRISASRLKFGLLGSVKIKKSEHLFTKIV